MNISEYIEKELFTPRLARNGCLVVYDPKGLYRDICRGMASERLDVVDAGGSGIESRERAAENLKRLCASPGQLDGFIIYVPAPVPVSEADKQADPYAIYIECGSVFPEGPADELEQICLKAKPDYATDIRRLFSADEYPSFAVIDAVGTGMGWPRLRSMLEADAPSAILFALLSPSEKQRASLLADRLWVDEASAFFVATIGLPLKNKTLPFTQISSGLWRFMLFSEFAFDLPCELPADLADIPKAPPEANSFVQEICERLRNNLPTRAQYIERSMAIEKELNLAEACRSIEDFGTRDTFHFEERASYKNASACLKSGNHDEVRAIIQRHAGTVWMDLGENRIQWAILESALRLVESCGDLERQLPSRTTSAESLAAFYTESFRAVDQLHRELEQSVIDFSDTDGSLGLFLPQVRLQYRKLVERMQVSFMKLMENSAWPLSGWLSNTGVFDKYLDPFLRERGRKIAYFLVDALRYELGIALEKLLSADMPVELFASCASLPSVTPVGMAALLPGAQDRLSLKIQDGELTPLFDGLPVPAVKDRMSVFATYGDRFAQHTMSEFLSNSTPLPDSVELLVLRNTDIDSTLESASDLNLMQIPRTLKQIRQALNKLRSQGFIAAIIAADHGFALNVGAGPGDVCVKPAGSWSVNTHDRMLLGSGSQDAANVVMPASRVGIKSETPFQVAMPRTMAPYSSGRLYFHGGLSLQEAIVPVLRIDLASNPASDARKYTVKLTYKNGAKKIFSRMPVVDIELVSQDLFTAAGDPVEVLIEAHDKKGQVVGETRPGGDVNPATRTIRIESGIKKQVVLIMDDAYEGKLRIKALNPATMAMYDAIDLETDYTV